MKTVAAITINWNGASDTLQLLDSLASQDLGPDLRLVTVIVDNASATDDRCLLREGVRHYDLSGAVRLVSSDRNLGVPAAYNLAIAEVGPSQDYYLRLDNDVILYPSAVRELISVLEEKRSLGVRLVGGNIKYFDRPSEDNGGAVAFDLVRGRTSVSYPSTGCVADGVLGCVMLLDGGLVRQFAPYVFLGWLFLTTDESELSLRAREHGWLTYYAAETIALHKGGRSTSRVADFATTLSRRNWSYLSVRYTRPAAWLPFVLARVLATAAYFTFKRPTSSIAMLTGAARGIKDRFAKVIH